LENLALRTSYQLHVDGGKPEPRRKGTAFNIAARPYVQRNIPIESLIGRDGSAKSLTANIQRWF
jgi:hypothetical protein